MTTHDVGYVTRGWWWAREWQVRCQTCNRRTRWLGSQDLARAIEIEHLSATTSEALR